MLIHLFLQECAISDLAIRKAGIDPKQIVLSARLRNALSHLKSATRAWYDYRRFGILDVTKPGSIYRERIRVR